MSHFDDKLIAELRSHNIAFNILPANDHASIVREINENIPFSGSKIAWSKLNNSMNFGGDLTDSPTSRLAKEIKKVADDTIIIVGDSVCDDAYCINLEQLEEALSVFSEIPQHTYIVQKQLNWIACISFEGDIDFALLKPSIPQTPRRWDVNSDSHIEKLVDAERNLSSQHKPYSRPQAFADNTIEKTPYKQMK